MSTKNHGWIIFNGSGWNNHTTVARLKEIETLPEVPPGYAVCVAPISDKPFGIRCALVRELERKYSPCIDYLTPKGAYAMTGTALAALRLQEPDNGTVEQCREFLNARLFRATSARPNGWPEGAEWFQNAAGEWANIELVDDGPEGEADGWVRDLFDIEGEIIISVIAKQQSMNCAPYFVSKMTTAIEGLKPEENAEHVP